MLQRSLRSDIYAHRSSELALLTFERDTACDTVGGLIFISSKLIQVGKDTTRAFRVCRTGNIEALLLLFVPRSTSWVVPVRASTLDYVLVALALCWVIEKIIML